jgi:hypothetical protein
MGVILRDGGENQKFPTGHHEKPGDSQTRLSGTVHRPPIGPILFV